MRYSFRLAELVGHVPDPRKRPGTIKAIVDATGLDRHQVAALLKNEVKYIPLDALSRLCDYLIERGYVAADQLPGALFAIEPENFWELLARRERLELCVGVRRADQSEWPEGAWVVASDSLLLGEVLNGVSTLGGTSKHPPAEGRPGGEPPHPEHLKQSLVWSPGQGTEEQVARRANDVFAEFDQSRHDKAMICLGSAKSNPVVDLVLATAFNCEPFQSQDHVAKASDRACPIFMRYRDDDPHPPSCVGGVTLSKNDASKEPGLYYEKKNGSWGRVDWTGPDQDAAFVVYVHRESQGRLEMILAGFSGPRDSVLLAKTLANQAQDFWPPVYEGQGMQVGAYVIQYSFKSQDDRSRDILATELAATAKVTALDKEVIARRLE